MRRIFFTAATILSLLRVHAQQQQQDTGYESRKLKVDEINLVSSYYSQSGNNAAVTGGIGSQHLTDIANVFDVRLFKYDRQQRKHTFDIEVGIDHYTSASSDKIDLKANSSASHADTRIYPSLTWSVENEKKGSTFGVGVSSSTEFDYQSFGANVSFAQKTKNRNGEFSAKLQTYLDRVKLVTPVELRNVPYGEEQDHYATANRNTYAGSLSYSQIINQRFEVTLLADLVSQHGYLGLPFYRVYFADGSVHQENLPDNRLKVPLGIRANYFLGDRFIIRAYYRFYTDDWGLTSHTANIELPVKITPFFSVSPFYRYYTQSAVKYFAPYQQHTAKDNYYTSNYDLSKFNSSFIGAGVRIAPPKGIFGMQHFNMLELRYGHYVKNINMNANIVSMNLRFK